MFDALRNAVGTGGSDSTPVDASRFTAGHTGCRTTCADAVTAGVRCSAGTGCMAGVSVIAPAAIIAIPAVGSERIEITLTPFNGSIRVPLSKNVAVAVSRFSGSVDSPKLDAV